MNTLAFKLTISSKGGVIIPKKLWQQIGMRPGEVIMASKVGKRLVLEPEEDALEIFTRQDISQMIQNDKLPKKLAKVAKKIWEDLR